MRPRARAHRPARVAAIAFLTASNAACRRGGRLQKLRQEQRAFFKAVPHCVERRDQRAVDKVKRARGLERLGRGRPGLGFETAADRFGQRVPALRRGGGLPRCGGRNGHRLQLLARIGFDIGGAARILPGQHTVGAHGGHHLGCVGGS